MTSRVFHTPYIGMELSASPMQTARFLEEYYQNVLFLNEPCSLGCPVPALPPLTSLVIIMHKSRKYFPNKQKLQHKA
jgi:hypothetical protein